MTAQGTNMSFWEHLDVLRASLIRIVAVTVLCGIAAFLFKEEVFTAVLAPKDEGFVTYRILERLAGYAAGTGTPAFSVRLINTGLAEQFVIHMKVSVYIGVLLASPYILYLLFRFISPALYANERKYASRIVGWGYVMFLSGVSVCYFLIFPLTFRFLGTYQVSDEVENMISLQSYIGTLGGMTMMLGIVFEIPVVCWLLARLGILSVGFMQRYRRHAVVVILVIAAIITPTSDIFTLLLVALPMWLLYEASILVVKRIHVKTDGK